MSLIDKGLNFSSNHFARAQLYVSVADKMGRMASRSLWVLY